MRPRTFAAALAIATLFGFAMGRWSASGSVAPVVPLAPAKSSDYSGSVVQVIDGDTLVVKLDDRPGDREKVRLLGIDTVERGQRWYAESTAALAELSSGRAVTLEFEVPGKLQRDKYGRILAYVMVGQQNANVEMVRRGWSSYIYKYGGERYTKDLSAAEEEARAAHRGIWASR